MVELPWTGIDGLNAPRRRARLEAPTPMEKSISRRFID
jgi:hypothetical protein